MKRASLIVGVLCAVLAPFAMAGPEIVEIDVSDLVRERLGSETIPVGWGLLHSNASMPARFIVGEVNLLCGLRDPEERPVFDGKLTTHYLPPVEALVVGDALVAALAATTKVDAKSLRLEDGRLKVSREDAPAVRAALAALRQAGPPAVQLDVQLEALDPDRKAKTLFTASDPVRSGVPYVIADAVMTNVLTDYEVEIAQACTIANPVIQVHRTGTSLLTRVHPVPGTDRAIVEAVLRTAEPLAGQPLDLGHPGFGPLDRCLTGVEEAAVTFVAENGKPTRQRWTGREGRLLQLTVTVRWEEPAPGDRLLWALQLENPIAGFRNYRMGALPHWQDDEDHLPTPVRYDLQRQLEAADERGTGTTPVQIDVLLVPAGTVVEPGKPAPEGATMVAQANALVTLGLPACFNEVREQFYIGDWDVEVAQGARIPDPIVYLVQEGHLLQATVMQHGEARRVKLNLELLRLVGIDRIVGPLDVAQTNAGIMGDFSARAPATGGSSAGGSIYSGVSQPQDTIALERPMVRQLRIASEIPVGSDGSGMLRRSARGFTEEAKDVVVIVRSAAP